MPAAARSSSTWRTTLWRTKTWALLRDILDPEAVNARAFADQAGKIAGLGGREAILAREGVSFGFTPLTDIADELGLAEQPDLKA
jgi:hypothetical protein